VFHSRTHDVGGGINLKPGILSFNEKNVLNYFINEDGQLMVPKEFHQLLEQHSNPKDIEDIILSWLQKEVSKYK